MKCPSCGYSEDKVLDTRIHKNGEAIKRRRECLKCKSRFTTQETLIQNYPDVLKKDGSLEIFIKTKIANGIQMACQKRPVSMTQIDAMVEKISQWALELPNKTVSSQIIGQAVMDELKNIDDVAYIRFASVYKTFKDVSEFLNTISQTQNVEKKVFENAKVSKSEFERKEPSSQQAIQRNSTSNFIPN